MKIIMLDPQFVNIIKSPHSRNCEDLYSYLGININVYITPIMEFTLLGLSFIIVEELLFQNIFAVKVDVDSGQLSDKASNLFLYM